MESQDTPIDISRVDTVVLDARPLSQIVHPREFEDITEWFDRVIAAGYRVVIPEVVDYEVRRGLLRIPARKQLAQLDALGEALYFSPLSRSVMQDAAHVWAKARNRGQPFTSDERLDGDAILIAQTRALGDLDHIGVITENVQHLSPFVPAVRWDDFEVDERS
jgi:predicted nucleic acid-binding protein